MSNVLAVASRLSAEEISRLSDADLVALADAFESETGVPILKETDRERALESQMATDLDEEYVDAVDEALDAELELAPEEMQTDEALVVVAGVGNRLEDDLAGVRGDRMAETLLAGIAAALSLGRRAGSALVRAAGGGDVGTDLTADDVLHVDALAGQQLWWIGRLYPDSLSRRIAATVSAEGVEAGLGRERVGQIVRGVVSGEFPGVAVPSTWPGSTKDYHMMLAGTVRNQAANFGALETFSEAGFERYRIEAVLDQRTSAVCRLMHGREFSVSTGLRISSARTNADDPEAAKSAAPWLSERQVEALPGYGEDPEAALARAGVAVPPFHGNCRTTVIPA